MEIDFEKCGGLVPAIIQDAQTKNVLMMGYMNPEAYQKTLERLPSGAVRANAFGPRGTHRATSCGW